MPAEVTWQLIGYSFIPLALGVGLLLLGLLVAKRWWWRAPVLLMALPPLALWLLLVFIAAYPTIHQTNGGGCLSPSGVEMDCESDFWQELRGEE